MDIGVRELKQRLSEYLDRAERALAMLRTIETINDVRSLTNALG